jgi:hypothetical protein
MSSPHLSSERRANLKGLFELDEVIERRACGLISEVAIREN